MSAKKKIPNEFIYRKARQECQGKTDHWIKQGINVVLQDMTDQINREDKALESEQLDRVESTLMALKDELEERQSKSH